MDNKTVGSIVEAVLFASGEAIGLDRLSEITGVNSDILSGIIMEMCDEYNYNKRGIKIIKLGNKYQMCTRSEYFEYIQQLVPPQKKHPLSKASIETLAIIAYKQPVTRSQISHVRGVDSDNSVNRLLELGLIEIVGKLDAPGRPALLATTDEFMRHFGLSGLDDLKPLDDYELDEILKNTEG